MTNFEKIKSMSVEEFSELLRDYYFTGFVNSFLGKDGLPQPDCYKEWLESEADFHSVSLNNASLNSASLRSYKEVLKNE